MVLAIAALGVALGMLATVLALAARGRATMADKRFREFTRHIAPDGSPLDPRAVRDVSVVRYDALKEMSGRLSFSIALLNASGDGVVITSINGRTETRTYAKVIQGGKGMQPLAPEEAQAVRSAQLGQGPPVRLADESGEADETDDEQGDDEIRVFPNQATA